MINNKLKIGIALSGGGIRAAAFHLGVLGRLAIERLLENVTFLSTVSGGSLVTGLIYSISGNRWPTSDSFIKIVLPQAKYYFTYTNIQRDATKRLLTHPWLLLQGKAKLISESLLHCWQIRGNLKDISTNPRWIINATCYESGKNWRFMPQRMGDYILNYVENPEIPIADAMAASAAYPGLIGPLVLKSKNYKWFQFDNSKEKMELNEPKTKKIHIWDGGVYDNLGVEALFKSNGKKFRDEYNFLIVSDASKGIETTKPFLFYHRAFRLVNIAMDQVRSLRARNLVNHFQEKPNSGVYLKIGNSAKYILEQAGIPEEQITVRSNNNLTKDDVNKAKNLETTLQKLTEDDFYRVYRHGWEVTNLTLQSRCPEFFGHRQFEFTEG
ncbi:MAG: patatin [Firmicutes bacterium HGW-Firmicutes-14]|jgi:NTE family protein|nr:MAG: patatin [Firmicutes bacterium HGW-Firmicutes-14]